MNKDLEKRVDKVLKLHKAIYDEINVTRPLPIEALKDAAHEELRLGENGSFTFLKEQTFNNKKYNPGDTIRADEIGLNTRARQIVNLQRVIQPTWHINQGKRNVELKARIRELENDYQSLTANLKAEAQQQQAVEAAEQALKNAKDRHSEIVTALEHYSDKLLSDANLTDAVKPKK